MAKTKQELQIIKAIQAGIEIMVEDGEITSRNDKLLFTMGFLACLRSSGVEFKVCKSVGRCLFPEGKWS